MRKLPIILAALGVVGLTVYLSVFIVDETEQALVLQFGQVKREIRGSEPNPDLAGKMDEAGMPIEGGPGLYFKIPFVQEVVYFEDRILPLDTSALEVTPIDDRRLVVDAFARWRIADPVQFRQAVQTRFAAQPRLERNLNAALREVLGSVPSDAVLSAERADLMQRIAEVARNSSLNLGVEIIDVRIKRADLPSENLEATYRRMNAEREREAADERARGRERAQEVRATAEREAVELVSDAERRAQEIRGEADGQRNRIYAEAFGSDEEFFAFYRSLEAYQRALRGQNSRLVISPNSEFFEYLKTDNARVPSRLPDVSDGVPSASDVPPTDEATPEPAALPESEEQGEDDDRAAAPAAPLPEPARAALPDDGPATETGDDTAEFAADTDEPASGGVIPASPLPEDGGGALGEDLGTEQAAEATRATGGSVPDLAVEN